MTTREIFKSHLLECTSKAQPWTMMLPKLHSKPQTCSSLAMSEPTCWAWSTVKKNSCWSVSHAIICSLLQHKGNRSTDPQLYLALQCYSDNVLLLWMFLPFYLITFHPTCSSLPYLYNCSVFNSSFLHSLLQLQHRCAKQVVHQKPY